MCTNLLFFTKFLKMAASQISKLWPYKLFRTEGYEVLRRKPEFLYYYKEGVTIKVFRFHHPMSHATRAQARFRLSFQMDNNHLPK